ncbi:probable G-protein coupled receptor 19 isoform X1 [Dendrobates tinctorius]|uniref:probable G-protein coupled receptor 19 isoform X1 n=2 Tax=Dendrobates tinctorius TaxID=92724 RepID=UPI003CCA6866
MVVLLVVSEDSSTATKMVFAHGMDAQRPRLIPPTVLYPMPNNSLTTCPMSAGEPWMPGLYRHNPAEQRNSTGLDPFLFSGEIAAAGLIFGFIWILSVFGNALVCLVIHRSRRTQSTTNYFVVSLACADLLLSLGSAPFTLLQITSGRWALGSAMCKLARYFHYLTPGVQIYVLLSICLDRFYTILYPLSFKVSREKAKRMIVASWLFDAAFVSPAFFFFDVVDGHCNFFPPPSWDGAVYGVAHLLVGFLVPSALILLFYQKVVKYIWRIGTDRLSVRRTMNIVPRTKVKTIKMFLMLNTIFLVSWMPFYVVQLWHPDENDQRQCCLAYLAVSWLSFGSSAAKPTLYSVYNANFRRGMKETFCMSSMKCYRSNAYTITTSSRMAKRNYVGICEMPIPGKTAVKESVYDSFDREAKEKKLAWPIDSNPPNTFV